MNLSTDIKFINNLTSDACTLTYSGNLFKNNSDSVSVVYGFNDEWKNTTEQEMTKTETGFTAEIKLLNFENLNFCFKNSNNEWDNNNNFNYTTPISKILEENFIINEDLLDGLLDDVLSCDVSKIEKETIKKCITQIEEKAEILAEPKFEAPADLFDNIPENEDFNQVSNFDMNSLVTDVLSPITQASVLSDSVLPTTEELSFSSDEPDNLITKLISNIEETDDTQTETIDILEEIVNNIENEIADIPEEENTVQPINTFEETINIETEPTTIFEEIDDTETKDIFKKINETEVHNTTEKAENKEDKLVTFFDDQTNLEEDKKIDTIIDSLINNLYEKANSNKEIPEIKVIDNTINSLINTNLETSKTISKVDEFTDDTLVKIEEASESKESLFDNIVAPDIPKIKQNSETSLVKTDDNFIVSSKSLSKFYMMRKRIKLAFYKIMHLPKILFGNNEN